MIAPIWFPVRCCHDPSASLHLDAEPVRVRVSGQH